MKTHLLALLQDNYLDLVRCAFSRKLSAFCQHLIGRFGLYRHIGKTQISASPGQHSGLDYNDSSVRLPLTEILSETYDT